MNGHQDTNYVYVITRDDLPGAQPAVQAIHAAIEAARCGLIPPEPQVHPYLALCSVHSEEQLLNAARRLDAAGIQYRFFSEPDIGDQFTALCSEPVSGDLRRVFRKFQLLEGAVA